MDKYVVIVGDKVYHSNQPSYIRSILFEYILNETPYELKVRGGTLPEGRAVYHKATQEDIEGLQLNLYI